MPGFHSDYKKMNERTRNVQTGSIDGVHRDITKKRAEQQEKARDLAWNETRKQVKICVDEQIKLLLNQEYNFEQILNKLKSDETFNIVHDKLRILLNREDNNDETKNSNGTTVVQNVTKGMIIAAYNKYVQTIDATKIAILKSSIRQEKESNKTVNIACKEENR